MRWLRFLVETLGSLQETYPGLFGFMNWQPGGMDPFFDIVRRELPFESPKKILDIGCGRGALSSLFQVSRYLGADISDGLLKYAQKKNPSHRYVEMSASNLGIVNEGFHGVLIVGVLHHLDDEQSVATLREMKRILKPGGQILIVEPIPVVSRSNVVGRFIKSLDQGAFIRKLEVWERMVGEIFTIQVFYQSRVGFNDLCVIRGVR